MDRSIDASVAGARKIKWLSSIHNRMSIQVKSSSGGSTPSGSTPNGSTPSSSDLLQFPVLQEFAGLTDQLVEAIESSKLILQRSNNEIGMLCESVRSLELRLSGIVQQLDIARTASLEKEFASGSEATELDLANLQQALAATRSQCLMLESQQKALAIKVEELIEQVAPIASPAPSPNLAESVDQDSHGTVGKNEWLATSPGAAKPRQAVATSQRRGSAMPLPLFVGGLAASALLGGGLVVVGANLFPQPEPGTAATTVPLLRKPLPASAKASRPPGPTATVSKPAPPAIDKLKIYCPAVCWVEVRRVVDGKKLYDGILKGSIQFPIGKGLHVSSGRSDILKLKINDGSPFVLNAREMLSSRLITSTS